MRTPRNERPRKRILRFDCGKYILRTIKREDASDRWAGWLSDPATAQMMNAPSKPLRKSEITEYIRQFDQRSRFLLGIFDKATRSHIGIVRVDFDLPTKESLLNILIGDPRYRGRGIMSEIAVSTFDYFFEQTRTEKLTAATLARNELIKSYLIATGWELDPTRRQQVKTSDGAMVDLCAFSLTRERWRAWKETAAAKRIQRRIAALKT
jgi:RimJ/RimL family protein N-acetyltransferase